MIRFRFLFIVVMLQSAAFSSLAQYTQNTYKHADALVDSLSKMIYHQGNDVHAINNSNLFWYRVKTEHGIRYFMVDPQKGTKKALFDHTKLLKQIGETLDKPISEDQLFLSKMDFNANTITFDFRGLTWRYNTKKNKIEGTQAIKTDARKKHWAETVNEQTGKRQKSPDEKYEAYIREYNLWMKDLKSMEETQLSFDGSPGEYYSAFFKWSPNSKFIAAQKIRPVEKRYLFFVESSPKDQLQPKLHKTEYAKPGDALPIRTPVVFSVQDKKIIEPKFGEYMKQYYLSGPEWRKDSRAFTLEYNQRGHQRYCVIEVDAQTGALKLLVDEQMETFFSYSGKKYRKDINDGQEMIWMSERDGWNHLYLMDNDGNVKNQITKGQWVVRKVHDVDETKREIIFSGSGKNKGEDPYHLHYYKIGFDGQNMIELTPENANHEVVFSDDHNYFIDYYSRADLPGKTVLRSVCDGALKLTLEETDIAELKKTDWNMPEVFTAKGRDGETDIWGLIYRPSNFDPNKKYPVIEYIYAGPHSSFVPKSFLGLNRRFAGLAELGFILVQMDGMGTSNRSKAFHDVCWKNLKDAGFPDRIKWIKAAAEKYTFMDTTRVGIMGTSAGGQSSTGAVLFHPEFYDVAVSSCGCHDNRMDKIWWNEQWMGYPIGKHYDECSNVTNAHKLQGNLMLILGEIDDNVDPASTMQVADALIKANKDFELVIVPGYNHTSGGKFGERKRRDFFVKHLLHNDTPNWNTENTK